MITFCSKIPTMIPWSVEYNDYAVATIHSEILKRIISVNSIAAYSQSVCKVTTLRV